MKLIGRAAGIGIAAGIFTTGLWAVNNAEYAWTLTAGATATIVGTLLIGAVATTIGKDLETWGNRQ